MINVSNTNKYSVFSSVNQTVVVNLLTIMNTQSSDVGTYICQAENFIGFDRNSGILTVNGKYVFVSYSQYNILIKQGMQNLTCAWFLEIAFVSNTGMYVCICSQGHSHE